MRRRSPWLASSHPAGTCAVHVRAPSALMRLTNSGESASAFHSLRPTEVVALHPASLPRKSEPYSAKNTAAKTPKTIRFRPLNLLPRDAPVWIGRWEKGTMRARSVVGGGKMLVGKPAAHLSDVAMGGVGAGAHLRRGRLRSSAAAEIVHRCPSRST